MIFVVAKDIRRKISEVSDQASSVSTIEMENIVHRLIAMQHRNSTAKNYLSIWRKFNNSINL